MKLIVGLGNPEPKYFQTRHNAGFWVVEKIATKYGAIFHTDSKLYAEVCKTTLDGETVLLAKPHTYMNLSGKAVQAILHWYKIPLENTIVIHDDVSLPLGKIRFQQGGGAGGQHGVESIIEHLGGKKGIDRLKFGIGPDPGGDRRAAFVLSAIPESEHKLRDQVIDLSYEALLLWVRSGVKSASNTFNGADLRPIAPEVVLNVAPQVGSPLPRPKDLGLNPSSVNAARLKEESADEAFSAVAASIIASSYAGKPAVSDKAASTDSGVSETSDVVDRTGKNDKPLPNLFSAKRVKDLEYLDKPDMLGDITIVDASDPSADEDPLDAMPPPEL